MHYTHIHSHVGKEAHALSLPKMHLLQGIGQPQKVRTTILAGFK